eukprot:TRINITY_DN2935_c0_g1_i3.p1 TRINITY_DN2935_c0_g1~~TRINITY_DN2935_c0_g1_i3.p1  ORF type:complete len:786 (-),score=131.20 TRINITY_DN2935_c0_g1_i3:288-2645(-)
MASERQDMEPPSPLVNAGSWAKSWKRFRNKSIFTVIAVASVLVWRQATADDERNFVEVIEDSGQSSAVPAGRRLDSSLTAETGWLDGMEHGYSCLSADQKLVLDSSGLMVVPPGQVTMTGCASGRGPCLRKDRMWMLVVYLIMMFYMFLALAIVCDEFFVPALEAFVDHYQIPMDIAGATFMAAGGSMPELFTSYIATFDESAVGFAAIVGSAVFNVLFVIAVCALAADEPLELTWWPLARDCTFYLLGLILVTVVFVVTTPQEIELWEAAILCLWYFAYCGFMTVNERVENWYKGKSLRRVVPAVVTEPDAVKGFTVDGHAPPLVEPIENLIALKAPVPKKAPDLLIVEDFELSTSTSPRCLGKNARASSYRAGIGQLLTQHKALLDTAGTQNVVQLTGKIKEAWSSLVADEESTIGEELFGRLVRALGWRPDDPEDVTKAFNSVARDEKLNCDEFTKWYTVSKARVMAEVRQIFKMHDTVGDSTVAGEEVRKVLIALGHRITDDKLDDILIDILQSRPMEKGSVPTDKATLRSTRVSYDEFGTWYHRSRYSEADQQKHEQETKEEEEGFSIDWPEDASLQQLVWYFVAYPLNTAMYCSLPDVRRPGMEGKVVWAIIEFILSLVWIAVFSVVLYECTVVTSNTVGILPEVAGVTVLAAGTSIPDLLSSYIVARKGEGDMAVSSSIGSNIFDITMGLPLPWMTYIVVKSAQKGEMVTVKVGADSLGLSIIVLIIMLAAVIVSIMAMGWKMHKGLGGIMLVLYFVFIAQDLVRQLPSGDPLWKVNF